MKTRILIALALLLGPAVASAQESHRFELTPRIGFNWGGSLDNRDTLFGADVEAKESGSYGLSFDIPLASALQLELLASRQATELRFDEGLFGPDFAVADIDISYYHVGLLWQGTDRRVSPFFVASLGVTRLDPDLPDTSTENRFSLSLGGGVKIFFSDHVGLRLEGRGFWTALDEEEDRYWDRDYVYDNDFTQGQASIGLIFAW